MKRYTKISPFSNVNLLFSAFSYTNPFVAFFSDRVLKAYPKTGITGYDFSNGWKPKGGQLDSPFPETELDILIFDVEV